MGVWSGLDAPASAGTRELLPALPPASSLPVPAVRVGLDDVYAYVFTSGTTGLPKAARIRHHRYLLGGAGFQAFAMWLDPADVIFTPLPLHHSSAQIVGFSTALAAQCCFAFSERFSATRYWDEARQVGATVGLYVGELCRYLVQTPEASGDRAHGVHTMLGNGLRADVWPVFQARFGLKRIVEFYGATEGNLLLVNRDGKVGSCGRPMPIFQGPLDGLELVRYDVSNETYVRDPQGLCVRAAPGETGELLGRISRLPTERFDGYVDERATNDKILRDVFHPGDAWFRTGDLLRRDTEGDYFFVDRIGDTFRWKGENVSTQAVAEALNGRGGTALVMVYGVRRSRAPGPRGHGGRAVRSRRLRPRGLLGGGHGAPARTRPSRLRARLRTARDHGHDEVPQGGLSGGRLRRGRGRRGAALRSPGRRAPLRAPHTGAAGGARRGLTSALRAAGSRRPGRRSAPDRAWGRSGRAGPA